MTPKAQTEYLTLVREGRISKLGALTQLLDEYETLMSSLNRIYQIGRSTDEQSLVAGFKSLIVPAKKLGITIETAINKEKVAQDEPLPKVRSSV